MLEQCCDLDLNPEPTQLPVTDTEAVFWIKCNPFFFNVSQMYPKNVNNVSTMHPVH